jgi:hypothetical protein
MNVPIILPNGSCEGQTIVQLAPVTRRPDRIEGIRLEATLVALRVGADARLAQVQEPGGAGGEARG